MTIRSRSRTRDRTGPRRLAFLPGRDPAAALDVHHAGWRAAAVWVPPGEPELTGAQEREITLLLEELLGDRQSRVVLDIFDGSIGRIRTMSRTTT